MARVSIIGGSGYTGGELIRILLNHPKVELDQITSRKFAGKSIWKAHPSLRNVRLRFNNFYKSKILDSDIVFLCVPHTVSMGIMSGLMETGTRVVDLSADFRLKNAESYERLYKTKHTAPELLEKAIYGIPELHRDEIRKADLVACAGCGATSSILALAPLKGHIREVIVDAKIGGSAAGRTPSLGTHYSERTNSVRPYAPDKHRHAAEIEQEIGIRVMMSSHAVDLVRGILTTNHVLNYSSNMSQVREVYRKFYRDSEFVRITPIQIQNLPNPKYVLGSNYCDIGFAMDKANSRLIVFSALDNLIKGAAGQAVQCMNLMLKLEEGLGLEQFPIYPL